MNGGKTQAMISQPKSKLAAVLAGAYLAVAVASLALIFVSDDSLSGVFAALIIQPWATMLVVITDKLAIDSFGFNIAFMVGGALLNYWIIFWLLSWIAGKFRGVR